MTITPTWLRAAALSAAFAVAATACGGGGGKPSSTAKRTALLATTTTSAVTTSTTTVESKVLADLAAYEATYHSALASPDQPHPEIAAHVIGDDMRVVYTYLAQLKDAHISFKGTVADRSARVVSIQGRTAVIDVCAQNDAHEYQDGAVQPDAPGDRFIGTEFTMSLDQGTWKVFNALKKPSVCGG